MKSFSNNILLLNLIRIRWIAIFGQFLAIIFVFYYLEINIPVLGCLSIIIISSVINTFSYLTNKTNNYLSDKEAFYFLLFDTIQLGFLLYLTGGIFNPFSLLLIAPLIIAASYLPIFYSMSLLILSLCTAVLISNFYIEIIWNDVFIVPLVFTYGISLSLIISLIFIFIYVYLFTNSSKKISNALSETRFALSNQKKLSEIGSLSAAAVHELSTPLNTIFLILNDLKEEERIQKNSYLKNEIDLLKSQADRCKEILLTLSKNPEHLKDDFFDKSTMSNLIKISFDKFKDGKIKLYIDLKIIFDEPKIKLKDELVYGIGNIIQNSIQYAKSEVNVIISWNDSEFFLTINDNGDGFNDVWNVWKRKEWD